MTIVRRFARPLLATPFIVDAVRTIANPQATLESSPKQAQLLSDALENSSLPFSASVAVRGGAVVSLLGGLWFATGKAPRATSLLMIAGSTLASGALESAFSGSSKERKAASNQLLTFAGLAGGVLLAAVDTAGKPSLQYRANKRLEQARVYLEERANDND